MLVMWEDCVEQRMNAERLEHHQLGMKVHPSRINVPTMLRFLEQCDRFAANTALHRRDGRVETLQAIDQYLSELVPGRALTPSTSFTPFQLEPTRT
jgi:hypothetical protein